MNRPVWITDRDGHPLAVVPQEDGCAWLIFAHRRSTIAPALYHAQSYGLDIYFPADHPQARAAHRKIAVNKTPT